MKKVFVMLLALTCCAGCVEMMSVGASTIGLIAMGTAASNRHADDCTNLKFSGLSEKEKYRQMTKKGCFKND